ncbi:MAG TPA: glycosyltransferase family 2 protein, partial [Ktedonobacterales bacterium]|nr:glycosyltransferase family 2 protein [Ktedonobacterales bacterium]
SLPFQAEQRQTTKAVVLLNMVLWLHIILLSVEIALVVPMLYLTLLSIAAFLQRPPKKASGGMPITRFALLIPAHNEEAVLGDLLASLRQLDYPPALMDVQVVADNCTDATAAIAREAEVFVHERQDASEIGKGYALRWLLKQVQTLGRQYDAYVVIDADTALSPNFLRVMDARLQAGQTIIQSQYRVQNGQESWASGLRSVAFALFNHLRPLGRSALGWSSGLKGTGMCFKASVVQQFGWDSFSLTEDVEYHVGLVTAGLRVAYAPEAVISSAMPTSLKQAKTQQARWERGRLELVRRHVPRLLWGTLRTGNLALFDAAMEIIVPPLSVVAGLIFGCCAGALLLSSSLGIRLGLGLLVGLLLYIVIGLRLARLPLAAYRSLLFAPAYIIWKLWVYLVALIPAGERRWVRTSR